MAYVSARLGLCDRRQKWDVRCIALDNRPDALAKKVIEGRQELGLVIDDVAGQRNVRSRQGAWGVLTRDLVTRSMSFELALIAAFAPFYNARLYKEDH